MHELSLHFELRPDSLEFSLHDESGRALDLQTTPYYHDLGTLLIEMLDKMLAKQALDPKSILSYTIQAGTKPESTALKVVTAVGEAAIFHTIGIRHLT